MSDSRYLRALLVGFCAVCLVGCGGERNAETETSAVVEELKLLRQDLAVMREAITDIHRNTLPGAANQRAAGGGGTATAPVAAATEVSLAGQLQSIGNSNATVGIVEFTDFQCPYCARHHQQTFPQLKSDYVDSGKIRYFFRDYPLGFHEQARPAAIAANCAARQNAFLPMYEELFANFRSLGPAIYDRVVSEQGLDKTSFEACLSDQRVADKVDNDLLYAQSLGVTGTPTFFVGRIEGDRLVEARRLVGAQSIGSFAAAIEAKLETGDAG